MTLIHNGHLKEVLGIWGDGQEMDLCVCVGGVGGGLSFSFQIRNFPTIYSAVSIRNHLIIFSAVSISANYSVLKIESL